MLDLAWELELFMSEMKRQEIEAALLESAFHYVDTEKHSTLYVGAEADAVRHLKDIEALVKKISLDSCEHFAVKFVLGRAVVTKTALGKSIVRYIELESEIQQCFPTHVFSPYVCAYFRAARSHLEQFAATPDDCLDGVLIWVDSMNNLVLTIREELRDQCFKLNVNRHRRNSNKNYSSLVGYIDSLFRVRSRLLVVRVDFGYSKRKALLSDVGGLGFDEVRKHREKLIVSIRNKLAPGALLGHAWKLEYGLSKSYHYHCIFFLDGSLVRQDIAWGDAFGRIWIDEITFGEGVSHNCNRRKEEYRYCGVGMISYADEVGKNNLKKAAMYITKVEYYVKLVTAGRFRTFGRGELPRMDGVKKGRRRANCSDRKSC